MKEREAQIYETRRW